MNSNSTLYVPHVGLGGGAGKYNQEIYKVIESNCNIAGRFSSDYASQVKDGYNILNLLVYVNYSGVSNLKKIYWCIISLFRFIICAKSLFKVVRAINSEYSQVVYTSSIQLVYGFIFKLFGFKGRQVIFIQENLKLDGFFGLISNFFLRRYDVVISITESWSRYASSFGVDSRVILNPFPSSDFCYKSKGYEYDILYVGGGGGLKGFSVASDFFKFAATKEKIRVAFLGAYSQNDVNYLKNINDEFSHIHGSTLDLIGQVQSIGPYICSSKIILIPIMSPHFCRPAVEAGFLNKTFIISDFDSLSDFAIDGYNCLKFKCGDVENLYTIYSNISESDLLSLQDNNMDFCTNKFSYERFNHFVLECINGY